MTAHVYPVSTKICAGDRAQGFDDKGYSYPVIFIAPIDLEIGDRCTININDGYLFLIERKGKVIWDDNVGRISPIPTK